MSAHVRIGSRRVGPGERVFVIAEAGVNHNGEVELARQLVEAAAAAGADAVKFQTFRAEAVAATSAPKAAYQVETTGSDNSQLDMLRSLELGEQAYVELKRRAEERGLIFLSTPFDAASVALLDRLEVEAFKVSSADLTNIPLLEEIGSRGRPVLLSTGMADLEEIASALDVLPRARTILLHCVSAYPAPPQEANLRALRTMADRFGIPVGYSDHTIGHEVALAAIALGACVLEKHVTLDRTLPGPDHRASLEPSELAELIRSARTVEASLGDGVKRPTESELANRSIARRSLHAAADLAAGTVVADEMLVALRPGSGIPPSRIAEVVGRKLARPVAAGEQLSWDALEAG
jgi:N,N'-diacetyllegionaminate synthase